MTEDEHDCPDCGAVLEGNVDLRWETAPPRHPATSTPIVESAECGDAAGAAYGYDVACKLLDTVGLDMAEISPGDRATPDPESE